MKDFLFIKYWEGAWHYIPFGVAAYVVICEGRSIDPVEPDQVVGWDKPSGWEVAFRSRGKTIRSFSGGDAVAVCAALHLAARLDRPGVWGGDLSAIGTKMSERERLTEHRWDMIDLSDAPHRATVDDRRVGRWGGLKHRKR